MILKQRKRLFYHITVISALQLMTPSCAWMTPADERIAKNRNQVSAGFQKELNRQQTKIDQGHLDVSWNEALNKMYLSNPSLIQADFRIADAKSAQKQIWRNFRPTLSVGANDSFTLENLDDAFSNGSFRINSFLSLGNLLTLPNNVYERKLTYIGTELSAENSMRQEVIALYRLFQEQRLLRLQKRAVDIEAELVKGVTGLEGSEVVALKLKNKQAREAWQKADQEWREQVGDFFMDGYDSVNLQPNGIPNIIYDPDDLDFSDTGRWGLLQLNLLALEEIASKGQFLDTYLRYLPRFSTSVSAPALFSSTSNTSFDPLLTRITPSLSWSLDTRGSISSQLNRLKRESPLNDWRNDKRQREEVAKLLEGKQALIIVQKELRALRTAMRNYQDIVESGLVDDPELALQNMRNLREQEIALVAREIETSSSFWLIDEQRWKPITKEWLATRDDPTKTRKKTQKGTLRNLLKS